MYWGYFHCLTCILVLWLTLGSHRTYVDAAFALLVWYSLRQVIYEYNQIETVGIYAVMVVYIPLCLVNYWRHKHWIHLYLAGIGCGVCVFNAVHELGPYGFKTGLGLFFQAGLVVVLLTCLFWSRKYGRP